MTVRRIDEETGDIATSEIQFISGRDEIAQTIRTRLRLFYGEYFRDITDGTPWFQRILGKNENLNAVEAILRTRIRETKGVIQLASFNMTYELNPRRLSVTGSVLTQFGLVEFVENG